jgi:hypothetical protein
MINLKTEEEKRVFFESLPESVTGPKDANEYPLKNIEMYLSSFKKQPDGITVDDIHWVVEWVLHSLYVRGFLTIKPLAIFTSDEERTNVINETHQWVLLETLLDRSGHHHEQKHHHDHTL